MPLDGVISANHRNSENEIRLSGDEQIFGSSGAFGSIKPAA